MPKVIVKATDADGTVQEETVFEAEVAKGGVLFEELDAKGHQLPHGCLAGSCGSCRSNILEGAELLAPPSAIEADTIKSVSQTHRERFGDACLLGVTLRMACRARIEGEGTIVLAPFK